MFLINSFWKVTVLSTTTFWVFQMWLSLDLHTVSPVTRRASRCADVLRPDMRQLAVRSFAFGETAAESLQVRPHC